MDEHHIRHLLEGDGTALSGLLRTALYLPGKAYGAVMALRRRAYMQGYLKSRYAGLPTISVGNVTAGGSGKTPMVALLARTLLEQGHTPGILMRGYMKSPDDESDEAALYRTLVPEAKVVVNPNRLKGAASAEKNGATVLLMDDGFQHLRLRRDLDIVLVDATAPWGGGNTIPGGLLREPRTALAAAHAVVVTRADQVDDRNLERIFEQVAHYAGKAFISTARHRPLRLILPDGTTKPLYTLLKKRVVVLAGIARPEAFTVTLTQLGAVPVDAFALSDHHAMSRDFVLRAAREAAKQDAFLVTTEKDWAKPVFRKLREEMAGPDGGAVRDDLDRLRVLGVELAVKHMDGLMKVVSKIAPTP